ncbi:MAG: hypothetical protein ACE10K_08705, partial [Rhodothermales bacterium]
SPVTIPYNGDPVALAATDELLAVGDFASTLTLFDITDPDNPVERGTANTAGATLDIVARGDLVFTTPDIFTANNVVEIFDVSDPDNPVRVSQYRPGAFAAALFLADSGTELLVATEEKLEIVDVSDPANPALLGSVALAGRGAEVTMLGTTAFVGSQQPENPQTGETPGWFLEAFDVSDPGNPQLLAATGDNDGPMLALTGLGEEFLVTSSPTGLQVFSFEASTGAFKVMDFMPSVDLTGVTPNVIEPFSGPSDLPPDCFPFFTTANTTPEPGTHGQIDSSGDGPSKGHQYKPPEVPPSTLATLTTTLSPSDAVFCAPDSGQAFTVAKGQMAANEEANWSVNQLTFNVVTNRLHKEDLIESQIKLFVGGQVFGPPGFMPASGLLRKLVFDTPALTLNPNETKVMEMSFALDYGSFGDPNGLNGRAPCSVVKEIIDIQLHINGRTEVDAEPIPNIIANEKLPPISTFSAVQSKRLACAINITDLPDYPDKPVGFPMIQLGEEDADPDESVGVCPGTYNENVIIHTKGLHLFSMFEPGPPIRFSGPDTTQIKAADPARDVVFIDADEVHLEGFFIRGGNNGVAVTLTSESVTIGADILSPIPSKRKSLEE